MHDAHLGGERGRGAAGKTPIIAAVETTAERKPGRLRLTVVRGFRKREGEKPAEAAIEPGSAAVSDGLSCWPAVGKAGCPRRPMVTGSGERTAARSPLRRGGPTLGTAQTGTAGPH